MTTVPEMQAKVTKIVTNADRFNTFVNGDENTDVTLDGDAVVPSLRKGARLWGEIDDARDQAVDSATSATASAVSAALSEGAAESLVGPKYASTAAGIADTVDGQFFAVDNGDGTVTIYLNDSETAVAQRALLTTAAAASPTGARFIGFTNAGADTDRTVEDVLLYVKSSDDFSSWGSRCFAVGDNNFPASGFLGVENLAYGFNILKNTTTGFANIAIGLDVLTANTTGNFNVAVGIKTQWKQTTAQGNCSIGSYSLYENKTGNANTSCGEDSNRYLDGADECVAVGTQSLYNNVSGDGNTACGAFAARNATNPGDDDPGTGPSPVRICAFGWRSVYNGTGTENNGFGAESLFNVTGSFNSALGARAGASITSGASNVFIGHEAGFTDQPATVSSAVGVGPATIAASNAVAVGSAAEATGASSVAIGNGAVAAGTNSIAIGEGAFAPSGNIAVYGNGSIGNHFFFGGIQPQTDGSQNIGGASARWGTVFATTSTINTSDEREKHWIGPLSEAELRAAKRIIQELGLYQWLSAIAEKGEDGARLHYGVRAQRAMAIMESEGLDWRRYAWACHDVWEESPMNGGAGDRYGIRETQLLFWLVSAQEQRLLALEARLADE